jgi:hypothetical protein
MSVIIDGSAGVTTNAGGSVNPSTNVEGINYSCRAWVNFNGTGTVAIRASGNVTSITDNNTGDYTVNFTTALTDANYSVSGFSIALDSSNATNVWLKTGTTLATSSFNIMVGQQGRSGSTVSVGFDVTIVNVSVIR